MLSYYFDITSIYPYSRSMSCSVSSRASRLTTSLIRTPCLAHTFMNILKSRGQVTAATLLQRLAADYKSGEFAGVPLDYARVARQRGLAGAAATLLSASNRTEYRGIRIRGTLFRAALAPGYSGYATDNSGVMLQWTKRGVPQVLFTPSLRVHVANVFRSRTVAYCIYTDLMYSRERIDR